MQRDRLLNSGVALGLVQAVAARLVEGAEGVRKKPCDVVLAAERVVLEDLVAGVPGAAANDAESSGLSVVHGISAGSGYTDWVLSPFEVKASSQTSSHQTGEVVSIDSVQNRVWISNHSRPKHHQEHEHPQTDPFQ
jgi:hypothetical protein